MSITSKLPKIGTTIFTVMSQMANDHGAIPSLVENSREQLIALYMLLERPEEAERYRNQATPDEEHH